uniref:Sulfotransfer_1 domain-containing protein n=1 Tax=Trichobilharzia regenti TaxID=157069 RepID=A0AA85JAD8_TRIRE|nr:unnamed protein product [Trichobilharzia regenti]
MRTLSNRRFYVVFLLIVISSVLIFIFANQRRLKCQFTHCFMSPEDLIKVSDSSFTSDNFDVAYGDHKSFPVVIYNRIPKTGSTSLVNLVYRLIAVKRIHTHVLHVNISTNRHYINRLSELYLIDNLTHWKSMYPLMIHGHFAYINFEKYGTSFIPVYINMIRNPLDRLVSYYYFIRYGDDYRPYLKRRRMSDPVIRNQTFDECVLLKGNDCNPQLLWVQVPFFCGQAVFCRIPGSRAALETAKRHVIEKYLIVGLTENFDEMIQILEVLLPTFFSGAHKLISNPQSNWYLRRTSHKLPISQATIGFFQKNSIWQAEQEFYDFVSKEFHSLYNIFQSRSLQKTPSKEKIIFDKISS